MRKKCLVYVMAAVLLLTNMLVTSYAMEAADVAQTEQEERIEEVQTEEGQIKGKASSDGSDVVAEETVDLAEVQGSLDSVSGNDGQGQDDNAGGEEEQPVEALPGDEETTVSSAWEIYRPYEGAKYFLEYRVEDNGIVIWGCKSEDDLGELVIPAEIDGVAVTTIGFQAFKECSGFTGSLTIPDSVTTIEPGAFYGCNGFTGSLTIPDSVTTIGDSAFDGCSGFTGSLTIPDSVTTIGDSAFGGCSGFAGSLTLPNSVTTIGECAFARCSGFTGSLTLPNNVTTIGGSAFGGCSGLTGRLIIPDNVTTIGGGAFSECSGFTGSLTIPDNVTTIDDFAFYGCSGFTGSLTLPDSATTIGDNAFEECSGFTGNLMIPDHVKYIGRGAFRDCIGLDGNLEILSREIQIEEGAFQNCKFKDLIIGIENIPDSLFNASYARLDSIPRAGCSFTGKLEIMESVSSIGNNAFENNRFVDIIIPDSVISIGKAAFRDNSKITKIFVSTQKIEQDAFYGCTNLRNIEIAASVKEIGVTAFGGIWRSVRKFIVLGKETIIDGGGLGAYNFVWGYTGSTAEDYARTQGCTFIPLDMSSKIAEYKVSTTQELLDAIGSYGEGSHRHVILTDGVYEISNAINLSNLVSVSIEAEHPGKAEILSGDGDSPVISIGCCADINIVGCILGHKSIYDTAGCGMEGYVIYVGNSFDVNIDYCDLYGCGITGVDSSGSEDINLSNCVIRDCMRNITGGSALGLNINNCIISGNAYDDTYASTYAAMSCSGINSLDSCIFLNNHSTTFKPQNDCEITLTNCSFYDNAWDNQTPKAYGICLNGITWQVDGDVLKIGYPLQLDADTVIQSKQGKVLDYSDSSLPWKKYKDLKIDVAAGVEYGLPQAAVPTITRTGDQLTIRAAMDGCTIYYTTNGTTPTAANGIKVNGSSVTLDNFSGTLRAIAVKSGYADSAMASMSLTNSNKDRIVGFDVKGVIGGRTVTFGCAASDAKVYYSTTSSTLTTKDKWVKAGQTVLFENFYGTVYARSYSNGEWGNVCRLTLKIPVVNTPVISTDSKGNVTIRTSTPGSMICYTTDGSAPTPANGIRVNAPSVTLPSFSGKLRAIAVRSCFTNSAEASRNLINSEKGRNVAFGVKGVFGGREVTFGCSMPGAKVYYSTTTSRITTKDKCVNAGQTVLFENFYGTVYARSYCNGEWGNVCRLVLKIPVVSTPTISIDSQGYATIRTATPGCYLYYTTDGSTPTMRNGRRVAGSQARVYVGRGVTVKAIAVRSCFTNSQVAEKK